jgi:hypothetical protein
MKPSTKGVGAARSPYTAQNVDGAIAHLERVLSLEGAHSLFGRTYWHMRVIQISATPGLPHSHRARLQRVLDLLADVSKAAANLEPANDIHRVAKATVV